MNDFTKKELEEISEMMTYGRKQGVDTQHNLTYEVEVKAQSMINAYYEKKSDCNHDWGVGFGSIHSPVTYCKLCGIQKPLLTENDFNKSMGINI